MTRFLYLTIVFVVFLISGSKCEVDNFPQERKIDYIEPAIVDRFEIVFDDNTVYNKSAIEFYDFSSHMIYLKEGFAFNCEEHDTFTVKIDDEVVYGGHIEMRYSSLYSPGPIIICPSVYADNIISIGLNKIVNTGDELKNTIDDFRSNKKIEDVLKSEGLFRNGLSVRITDVNKICSDTLKISLKICNRDESDLYYLDPGKIGLEKFHYFTEGLKLTDSKFNIYSNNIKTQDPGSATDWREEWLSVIHPGENKNLELYYDNFDDIPVGSFFASFTFPGVLNIEADNEIWYNNGRIWLGKHPVTKIVQID